MTDCPDGLMRDLLPEYAHGVLGAEAAARVSAHLDACDACRAELALLAQLRAGLDVDTPRIDVAAIARALPVTSQAQPALRPVRGRGIRRQVWQYAAAAGLVLAVGGGLVLRNGASGPGVRVADTAHVQVPGATQAWAPTATSTPEDDGITFGGGLSDLTLEELQALLGQMDSVRTLPSSDPESVTPVIAMNEGGKTL